MPAWAQLGSSCLPRQAYAACFVHYRAYLQRTYCLRWMHEEPTSFGGLRVITWYTEAFMLGITLDMNITPVLNNRSLLRISRGEARHHSRGIFNCFCTQKGAHQVRLAMHAYIRTSVPFLGCTFEDGRHTTSPGTRGTL
jgi:hypothetical protein